MPTLTVDLPDPFWVGVGGVINEVLWGVLTDPLANPPVNSGFPPISCTDSSKAVVVVLGPRERRTERRKAWEALGQQEGSTDHRLRECEGQTTKAGCSFYFKDQEETTERTVSKASQNQQRAHSWPLRGQG